MSIDGSDRSLELLSERVASIPAEVTRALESDAAQQARASFPKTAEPLAIVGAGGSSGPATFLAACLERQDWRTRLLPPSCFAFADSPFGSPLCVVSQGMSPNAQIALRLASEPPLLITAVKDPAVACVPLRHGPDSERELLVRVVGPALACLAAVRFSELASDDELGVLPSAIHAAAKNKAVSDENAALFESGPYDHVVLITADSYRDVMAGLRWKLLETLCFGDPTTYDVLQFAHGPFQQMYNARTLLLVLDKGSAREDDLFSRLQEMVPDHHLLLRLRATLPFPLCWFEHDALLNQLVLSLMRRNPRDLISWAGKGLDRHLYELGR